MLGEGLLEDISLKAEFSDEPHKRGIVSIARDENPDSGGSQFFICLKDSKNISNLDKKYTVIGEVVSGMDVVDKIARVRTRELSINGFKFHSPKKRVEMKIMMLKTRLD